MKLNNTIIKAVGAAILGGVLLVSCVKKFGKETALEDANFNNMAFIQVYNASVPATSGATARNYLYIDNKQVTGAGIAYGSVFPSGANSFAVTAGFHEFLIKDTLASASPAQPQLSFAENLQAGKYYTIFMYDTVTQVKQKTVA